VYATARKLGLLDGLQQCGCRLLELDVTDTVAAGKVVQHVLSQSGRIDILVNNAGSAIKGWAVDTPMQDVRQLMEVCG
jgi:NADP-dependent 3-hydroxy acid dehydrogenase YdfG